MHGIVYESVFQEISWSLHDQETSESDREFVCTYVSTFVVIKAFALHLKSVVVRTYVQ